MNISASGKNSMLKGLCADINSGVSRLSVTDGVNELVSLPLPNPMQASIAGGKVAFNPIAKALVTRSGAPTLAHIMVGGDIKLTLSIGADLILDKPSIQAGGYLNIQALSITI